ncbi:hypothetical protein AQUCO_00300069v1 [Aquilegia coerulea]|uniref:Uncharacterized protein n=1 Tax=Aquilegia coerulea TaxID=218851 RepID=A0A2G5EX52_AQUCA|nr:hypothetical protein AQUCO_00300069v1 [Aquilegia coerulea]
MIIVTFRAIFLKLRKIIVHTQYSAVDYIILHTSKQPSGKDPGEDLVGSKIKVWWPDDKKFYESVVESFDPIMKLHKVVYLDGEEEILFLKEERWENVEGHTVAEKVGELSSIICTSVFVGDERCLQFTWRKKSFLYHGKVYFVSVSCFNFSPIIYSVL